MRVPMKIITVCAFNCGKSHRDKYNYRDMPRQSGHVLLVDYGSYFAKTKKELIARWAKLAFDRLQEQAYFSTTAKKESKSQKNNQIP